MAEQSWLGRLIGAIEREYERRVRRASDVLDYSASQPHKDHAIADQAAGWAAQPTIEAPEEEAAIVNVPRGTKLARSNVSLPTVAQPPADKDA